MFPKKYEAHCTFKSMKGSVWSLLGDFGANAAEEPSNCFYIIGCKFVTNYWDLCVQQEKISSFEFHMSDTL